jgi:hypothetical protein
MGVARRTATALVLAAALAACQLAGDHEHARVGPTVVVAEGRDGDVTWRYEIYRTADGYCEAIASGPGAEPSGCSGGNVDIAPGTVSVSAESGTDRPTFVYGRAGDDVATVRITTSAGDVQAVETIEAPAELGLPGRFFFEVLPEGAEARSVATLDVEGSVLETHDLIAP